MLYNLSLKYNIALIFVLLLWGRLHSNDSGCSVDMKRYIFYDKSYAWVKEKTYRGCDDIESFVGAGIH